MVTQTGIEIRWDVEIKTTTKIKHNSPDSCNNTRRKELATDLYSRPWQIVYVRTLPAWNYIFYKYVHEHHFSVS